ncbi:MAG: uS8 family ribosomal protein [Patescibacteria group bacterium]
MSLNHYMSDFVARVNNAVTAGNPTVEVLKSNLIKNCVLKLTKLGYFSSFEESERTLTVTLNKKITKLKVVSKPGQRVYATYTNLPKVVGGIGYNIISTSKGVLSNVEAKSNKVGGELLFQIY